MKQSAETSPALRNRANFVIFVRVKNFGTSYLCLYYDEKLYDDDGWLIRCPKCLNEQRKENGIEQSTSF